MFIKPTDTRDEAYDEEQRLLQAAAGHPALLNTAIDSSRSSLGVSRDESFRQRLLGNKHAAGYVWSEEDKLRMAERMRGNQHLKGYKFTEEQINNVRIGLRNAPENKSRRPVTIDGTEYRSIAEAAEQLDINYHTLRTRLRSQREKESDT